MNRRYFLMSTAAVTTASRANPQRLPSDTVRVACVGFNGRGRAHIQGYLKTPNTEIAALCDVDEAVLERGLKTVEAAGRKRPAAFTDLRKLLEDKSIDAISIATPNHQHTLQTIWGCQAGKDVYVEKPCSYNIFESRQIVAAARKYNRIVMHGTGASASLHEARQAMADGAIGDVYMARGLCFKWRDTIGRAREEPVPPGVHYDLWLGPADKRLFTRNRFHYNFHWFWDYGNGDFGNQGSHQMHAARWALGVKYPTKVSAAGGHFIFDDDQETPNTLVVTLEYNHEGRKKVLIFEVRHWITNTEGEMAGKSDEMAGPAAGAPQTVGNLFYGSKGYLVMRGGFRTFLGKEQALGPASKQAERSSPFANFVAVVRSRKREDLKAEIEEGAISMVSLHLGNIAYRLGRTLHFDPESMRCIGDDEANAMFTRKQYRPPFVIPKLV